MPELTIAFTASLLLGGFHLLAPALERVPARYRAPLASFSGGAGLAYVFLYLLFELVTEGAEKIHALVALGPAPVETLFILLLGAFIASYVVQVQLEKTAERRDDHRGYAILFLTYNLLAGAGLREEATWGAINVALYVVAIGLHLLFNDRFLLHLDPQAHSWRWRGLLAIMPAVGCAAVVALDVSVGVLYAMLALVAGGTIINVVRQELPEVKLFRPLSFVGGAVLYALLIFAAWRF